MSKYFYFKIAFVATAAGLFAGSVVYGLFDIDCSNLVLLGELVFKSAVKALVTALVFGIGNMYLKILPLQKK